MLMIARVCLFLAWLLAGSVGCAKPPEQSGTESPTVGAIPARPAPVAQPPGPPAPKERPVPASLPAADPPKPAALDRVRHGPAAPKPDVPVLVTANLGAKATKVTLRVQAVAPGKYVRKS